MDDVLEVPTHYPIHLCHGGYGNVLGISSRCCTTHACSNVGVAQHINFIAVLDEFNLAQWNQSQRLLPLFWRTLAEQCLGNDQCKPARAYFSKKSFALGPKLPTLQDGPEGEADLPPS